MVTTVNYYVYVITHIPSGLHYYGKGSCVGSPEEDNYFGSGAEWKVILRKYPKKEFDKCVLFIFNTEMEAFSFEKDILNNEDILKDPLCMNLIGGGRGGRLWKEDNIHRENFSKAMRKLWEDSEYRERQSENMRRNWENSDYRENHRRKMRERWKDVNYRSLRSQQSRDYWKTPGAKENQRKLMDRLWSNSEYRDHFSRRSKEAWENKERRENASIRTKQLWKDPDFIERKLGMSLEDLQELIEEIFQLDAEGFLGKDIAEILGKSRNTIYRILRGERWAEFTKELRKQRNARIHFN